jgi:hypothetical protein
MSTVEMLCRLQLVARRLGCTIRVHGAGAELRELVTLAGLAEVLLAEDGDRAAGEEHS